MQLENENVKLSLLDLSNYKYLIDIAKQKDTRTRTGKQTTNN